jgi:hypothetical protein
MQTLKFSALGALTATLMATTASADGHSADMGFALANDGGTLVMMADITAPTEVGTTELSTPLAALAWRPVTGTLMGFTDGKIFEVNTETGELTDLEAAFADDATIADGALVAFDFNNKIDAVRAVSSAGDNLVYFPEGFGDNDERAGTVIRVTDMAYAEDDANAGAEPMVFANAYTNAINGMTAGSTFQYGLDAGTDALISIANNAGTLATVAPVMVDGMATDISAMGGFDIMSPEEGSDMAYAILQMEGADTAGFYMLDLETGEAMMQADLGMGGFTSLAIARHR